MITGLKRRLKKIEDQYGSRWGDTVAAAGRITRAVLTVLRRPKRSGKGNVMRKEMSLRSLQLRIDGLERRNRAVRTLEQVLSP
jgi:hypothetical protein